MKALLSFIAFFVFSASIAQNQNGPRARGMRNYDPRTVTTVHGKIKTIENPAFGYNGGMGVHLLLQTSSEEISVHVGPQWYVEKQAITFVAGEEIKIEGSRIKMNGKWVIIARNLTKGDKTIELRTQNGVPLWSRKKNR